jgi:hypothetical protein
VVLSKTGLRLPASFVDTDRLPLRLAAYCEATFEHQLSVSRKLRRSR